MHHAIAFAAILLALMLSAAADADPPATQAQEQEEQDQPQCAPLAKMQRVLKSKYGEGPVAVMDSDRGPLMIFSNNETGTFTIVQLRSAEESCAIASGDHFHVLEQKPGRPS